VEVRTICNDHDADAGGGAATPGVQKSLVNSVEEIAGSLPLPDPDSFLRAWGAEGATKPLHGDVTVTTASRAGDGASHHLLAHEAILHLGGVGLCAGARSRSDNQDAGTGGVAALPNARMSWANFVSRGQASARLWVLRRHVHATTQVERIAALEAEMLACQAELGPLGATVPGLEAKIVGVGVCPEGLLADLCDDAASVPPRVDARTDGQEPQPMLGVRPDGLLADHRDDTASEPLSVLVGTPGTLGPLGATVPVLEANVVGVGIRPEGPLADLCDDAASVPPCVDARTVQEPQPLLGVGLGGRLADQRDDTASVPLLGVAGPGASDDVVVLPPLVLPAEAGPECTPAAELEETVRRVVPGLHPDGNASVAVANGLRLARRGYGLAQILSHPSVLGLLQ
jgi:hypothetical protein